MDQYKESTQHLANSVTQGSVSKSTETSLDHSDESDFEGDYDACTTPDKHSEVLKLQRRFANPFSLTSDADNPYDSQISPASVLPEPPRPPLKVLLAQSHSLQSQLESPSSQYDDFEKLRQQHAQLLAYNHILVEENNHRLMDHADLMAELMTAQQRAYQAERASATAVANATQLQREVLRLSNQMDALREASEAQSSVVESQQEELALCEQQLSQHQESSVNKVEKKSWEAADWKAKALEANQKLATANAQIAEQSRVIVAQEQKYAQDVNKLSLQLMRHSAAAGIQSFSPLDFEDDADD